ncbi:Carboxymuconolactone decarboxylase [Hyphomicrobiales bacterium]|nr:Carboxymuconolactone decarboxylase [Hyphomicrobiales bacterium]CAH1671447.1 Carboxymuconolactone decarboxylase [Hyphomicrobiales bacterium]
MKSTDMPHPIGRIANADPATAQGFKNLRAALNEGPIDYRTGELILLSGFITLGYEEAVKIHACRLIEDGMSVESVRQCALFLLGACATMVQVSNAIKWIDEVAA